MRYIILFLFMTVNLAQSQPYDYLVLHYTPCRFHYRGPLRPYLLREMKNEYVSHDTIYDKLILTKIDSIINELEGTNEDIDDVRIVGDFIRNGSIIRSIYFDTSRHLIGLRRFDGYLDGSIMNILIDKVNKELNCR